MTSVDTSGWQSVDLPLYGVRFRMPADWETLPPVPANGHELVRATGRLQVIVFKLRSSGRPPAAVAAGVQERLEAQGFTDFERSEVAFAGRDGALLTFRGAGAGRSGRTSWEYIAVRGAAVFVLGLGTSDDPDRDRPLVEAVAGTFELVPATPQPVRSGCSPRRAGCCR